MIETVYRFLDELFLEFKHFRFLIDDFDKGSWTAVLHIVYEHHIHAICPVCLELCLENCCDACDKAIFI